MTPIESVLYMVWRGLAVGVLISAPMGPVGILCIQRTLDRGRKAGLCTGIGAAISDLFYCLLTGFGLSFIEDFLQENSNVIQLFGSVVLIAFSIYLFRKNPSSSLRRPMPQNVSAKKNILGGFLFTFSNPLIIFLIIGLFARFNFTAPEIQGGFYAVGYVFIIAGALMWWYGVTYLIDKVRMRFNMNSMKKMNVAIGVVILAFAAVGIVTSIIGLTSADAKAERRETFPLFSGRGDRGLISLTPQGSMEGYDLLAADDIEAGKDSVGNMIVLMKDGGFGVSDTTGYRDVDVENIDDWSIEFRLADLNSHPGRSYRYKDSSGGMKRVKSPGWSAIFTDYDGNDVEVKFHFEESEEAAVSTCRVLMAEVSRKGDFFYKCEIRKGIDTADGWNLFRIGYTPAEGLTLNVGNHGLEKSFRVPGSVGALSRLQSALVKAQPGGRVRMRYPSLSLPYSPAAYGAELSLGEIEERLRLTSDPAEGEWRVLDYTLEDTKVKLGGEYYLAIVCNSAGKYEMVYLSGGNVNGDSWHPGMIKGWLTPTGMSGIYDAEWRDIAGHTLPVKIKAQIEGNVMTLHLPQSDSRLRFYRLR